jgi:hypothetical protein
VSLDFTTCNEIVQNELVDYGLVLIRRLLRGTVDLFFPLLALSRVDDGVQQTSSARAAMPPRATGSWPSQSAGIAVALR